MNSVVLQCSGINKLNLVEFPKPEPDNNSALLRIKTCGICGTDVHGIEGKRPVKFPFIPGHEIVAVVDSMGKNANDFIRTINGSTLKVGERVTINPRIVCSKCYYCINFPMFQEMCINAVTATAIGSEKYPHLFGGWAEYFYLSPGSEIIKLPEDISDKTATLIEPFSVGVGCIDRYKNMHDIRAGRAFEINDTIVIYGIGAIGMLMLAGFHLAGAKKLIVLDVDESKLQLSKEFGADHAINVLQTSSDERIELIKGLTQGLGAGIVIESCGVPSVINEGIKLLRRGGILFEIGQLFNAGLAEIDPFIICRNEIKLLGHYAYPSSQTMLYAAKILKKNELPYDKLLKFFRLDQYKEVIFEKKTDNAIKPAFLISE